MSDYIVRATAGKGQIRAFAATTREMAETARKNHNTSPVATAALGRLLTAGAMMGQMMKGGGLLTLQILAEGPIGGLTVTSDSEGHVKGYAVNPRVMLPIRETDHKLDVAGAVGSGYLRVIRDLGLKEPYIGETKLVSGEIAEDITYYYAQSEQTPSAVGLGVLVAKENTVSQAGGFIVQLMPDATEEAVSRLEQNLSGISSVTDIYAGGGTPEDLLGMLLEGLELEILEKRETAFACDCSPAKIEKALISVGRKDLTEMAQEGKEIEMCCSFCGRKYIISPEKLNQLAAL